MYLDFNQQMAAPHTNCYQFIDLVEGCGRGLQKPHGYGIGTYLYVKFRVIIKSIILLLTVLSCVSKIIISFVLLQKVIQYYNAFKPLLTQ